RLGGGSRAWEQRGQDGPNTVRQTQLVVFPAAAVVAFEPQGVARGSVAAARQGPPQHARATVGEQAALEGIERQALTDGDAARHEAIGSRGTLTGLEPVWPRARTTALRRCADGIGERGAITRARAVAGMRGQRR